MVKCTEVMLNSSSIYMLMDTVTYINLDNVKYITPKTKKFNNKNIYCVRFTDQGHILVISEELDKLLKLD